jgi:hypothetical protein
MSEERPGGWVQGIGWVALLHDLPASAEVMFAPGEAASVAVGESDHEWSYPVIVTRWPDGSEPAPPVAAVRADQQGPPDEFAAMVEAKAKARVAHATKRMAEREDVDYWRGYMVAACSFLGLSDESGELP